MNTIATVIMVICVVSIAGSLITIVVPKDNTGKVLATVLGVFIICSMIVPIKTAVQNFSVNINVPTESEDLTASADEAFNRAVVIETQNKLESQAMLYLSQEGINVLEVSISLESDEKGGIYIDNIIIYIQKEDETKTQIICDKIKEKFEITPNVILR
ncbi:MAG: hypothetical protein ACI4RM_03135 [Ruminococcus sp.]